VRRARQSGSARMMRRNLIVTAAARQP
jgi:hypothetical protein